MRRITCCACRVPITHRSRVECTHIEVPQVEQTYEVLLAKPFWIWGAEMGANERGVVIGNESIFAKVPYEKRPGLLGMDLLRLGLERGGTAREALGVITGLLEAYGQGGNHGFTHPFYYHNSFIIADPHDAWVLETAGHHWAAEQVKDIRTISNGLTIGSEPDLASSELVSYAVKRGWCKGRDDFHFGRCYSDFVYTTFSYCALRRQRTQTVLGQDKGGITVQTLMRALRDHGEDTPPGWAPARGLTGAEVCWHAGLGPLRGSQTTGSMVSHLAQDIQTHFMTATAAPCTSIFKPVWMGVDLPDTGPAPSGTYDEASLFWRHEALHRATLRDYATLAPLYREERNMLERQFVEGALACVQGTPQERYSFSQQCFAQADAAERRWLEQVLATSPRRGGCAARHWSGFNGQRKCGAQTRLN
jgi:dipeptidase